MGLNDVRPDSSGDVADLPSNEQFSNLLECPVCNETPFPPIYSCIQGHSVCSNCCKQLKQCPLCQAHFSKARNYFMESIVLSTKFFCKYQMNGCKEKVIGEKFQDHLKKCLYRNGRKVNETPASANPPPSTSSQPSAPQASASRESQRTTRSNANSENSYVRRIGGCFHWVPGSANDPIPVDAVEGGIEHGTRLYVGRSKHSSGLFPGKIHAGRRIHSFPWESREQTKNEYEVLIAIPETLQWVNCDNGIMPSNALIGGRTEIGEALYIGRCGYNGTLSVGWVLPSQKIVRITYKEKEHTSSRYEVLVKTELGLELDLET